MDIADFLNLLFCLRYCIFYYNLSRLSSQFRPFWNPVWFELICSVYPVVSFSVIRFRMIISSILYMLEVIVIGLLLEKF